MPEAQRVSRDARPGRAGQLPATAVLATAAAGLLLATQVDFGLGALALAGALLLAAALRIVLPTSTAGWLVVRSRAVDVAVTLLLGGALLVLAVTVPRPG